jgi:Cdc6-like AAA superfamily ATPase
MMSKERELLRRISSHSESRIPAHFIYELKELLAQPEQEPLSEDKLVILAEANITDEGIAGYYLGFRDAEKHTVLEVAMSNVTELPPHENMSVNQVLDHIKRKDLKKVFIIGIDENDKLITRASKMNFSEVVYFLELAKFSMLEHSNE